MNSVSFKIIILTVILTAIDCQKTAGCPKSQQPAVETITCECSKLEECLNNQQQKIAQFESDCRKTCSMLIGENVTEILDCLSRYENSKRNEKLEMEKCMHDLTGKPCVGNKPDTNSYVLMANLTGQQPPNVAASSLLTKSTLASIKNHPLLNPYRKCYKTCMKGSPVYVQPTVVGGKVTKTPSCFEQFGCVSSGAAAVNVDKALRKVAKHNCALQIKADKTSLKMSLAECLQKAFSNRSTSSAACEKPHSDEL